MFRKKLIVCMTAAVIGMMMYGGSTVLAHEGHDHNGATGRAVSTETSNKGELCPVSGEEIKQQGQYTYEYKGKTYNLCCVDCLGKFKNDPEKYIGKMSRKAAVKKTIGHQEYDHH